MAETSQSSKFFLRRTKPWFCFDLLVMTLSLRWGTRDSIAFQKSPTFLRMLGDPSAIASKGQLLQSRNRSFTGLASSSDNIVEPPLLLAEGLFTVNKPLNWTSSDVVSYIRGILERDARTRGARPEKVGSRRNKNQIIKVGHGGTLDPLATGVLVIGVGKGTKELQR